MGLRETERARAFESPPSAENSKWRRIDEKANGPRGEMESADNDDEIYSYCGAAEVANILC